MRVFRRLLQLCTFAASAVLCAAAAEWVWRRVANARYDRARAAFAEPLLELVPGPELYALRANADVRDRIVDPAGGPALEVQYRVLPERVRWHPVWPPPPDEPRVLFVGDSYTFGTAVADGVAFPHQVEAMLRAHGVPAFAINAGVPGHDSEQEAARLPSLCDAFTPALVVAAFVVNDAEPPVYAPIPPAVANARSESWLLEDGRDWLHALTAALVDDRPLWVGTRVDYDWSYRGSWAADSDKATRCLAAVAAMHAECTRRGVPFVVAILPDFTRAFDDTYPYEGIHAQVLALGARGCRVADLLPALRGMDAAALRVPGDGHPNADGHRCIAAALAPLLTERLRG